MRCSLPRRSVSIPEIEHSLSHRHSTMRQSRSGGSPLTAGDEVTAINTDQLALAPLDELFRAMQSDDPSLIESAWGECYRRYNRKVWSTVFYVIRTIPWLKEPAEVSIDVTSEVFARLPDAVRHYSEVGRAEAWLMQIAVRGALRQKESITGAWSKKGNRRITVEFDDKTVDQITSSLEGDELDARLELTRRMESWSDDPAKSRWPEFVQFFLEGYGHEEIAERMGITAATSRTWLWKIRRDLGKSRSIGTDK